ncbi:MAG: MBL fold metallo-hydrolase [Sandaracinaceae bacterium]
MNVTVFKAHEGDSMLIRGARANVLVDGGKDKKGNFDSDIAPTLEQLTQEGGDLDLVCVSHIDDDHILGVLRLYERRVAWASHRANEEEGLVSERPPFGEPPRILRLWHNGLDESFKDASVASTTRQQLAFHRQLLDARSALSETEYAHRFGRVAQGVMSAVELQLTFAQSPMNIEFNGPGDGDLVCVGRPDDVIDVNGLSFRLLGPFEQDFARLRTWWEDWVSSSQQRLDELKAKFRRDTGSSNGLDFLAFAAREAELGAFHDVQPPNLVSIMFLVEEDGRTVLMTGDGAAEGNGIDNDGLEQNGVIEGLEHAGLLADGRGLHVDVLKVPHHGSKNNTSPELARRVTADHYVFSSNGAHKNPHPAAIRAYLTARLGEDDERTPNPRAQGRSFKLWFNYHPDNDVTSKQRETLQLARRTVEEVAQAHPGAFEFEFVEGSKAVIDL